MNIKIVFSLLFFLIFLPIIGGPAESNSTPPDVLFIILDDASSDVDWMGGLAHMPNLSAIAAQGTTFHNMTTDSSVCNPARVSMLTGLLPTNTCITDIFATNSQGTIMKKWRQYANECPAFQTRYNNTDAYQMKTLIDVLDEDYVTLAVGKIWHDGTQQWIDEKGSINRGRFSPTQPRLMNLIANQPLNSAGYDQPNFDWGVVEDALDAQGQPLTEGQLRDSLLADDMIFQIDQLPDNQPVAAFFGQVGMHTPHYVPQRLYDLYDDVPLPMMLLNQLEDFEEGTRVHQLQLEGVLAHPEAWREFMQSYYASLTFADEQIGRVWQAWLDSGRNLDNSYVVLWSDHGYSTGAHANLTKTNLWVEQMRVPFFIAGPDIRQGAHSFEYLNSVDIYPTILDLAGVPMPTDGFPRDGTSLRDIAVNGNVRNDTKGITCVRDGCAIINKDWAYIDWLIQEENYVPEAVGVYNLKYDPKQFQRQPMSVVGQAFRETLRQALGLTP